MLNNEFMKSSTPQPTKPSSSTSIINTPTTPSATPLRSPTPLINNNNNNNNNISNTHRHIPKSNSSPPILTHQTIPLSSNNHIYTSLKSSYEGRLPYYRSISAPSLPTQKSINKASSTQEPTTPPQSTPTQSSSLSPQYNSNFQLPNDILRNLTPIARSPPKDKSINRVNKQNHLKSIQARLGKKSHKIEKTILTLKQQRLKTRQLKHERFKQNLKAANIRRNQYLELIKLKATKFIKDEDRCVKRQPQKPRDIVKSSSLISEKTLDLSNEEIEIFINLQKQAKRKLYNSCIDKLSNNNFLNHFQSLDYNTIIQSLDPSSQVYQSIHYVLNYLQIDHYGDENYRSFFHCFIMVGDFNDCIKHSNASHPGFNSNTSKDELVMFSQNLIWLKCFKFGLGLIEEFKQIVNRKSESHLAKFKRYWKDYNFVFQIFKYRHYLNIKDILHDSITIVNNQIQIVEAVQEEDKDENKEFKQSEDIKTLYDHHKRFNQELTLLNSYNMDNIIQRNQSKEVLSFIHNLESLVESLFNPNLIYIQKQPNYIGFNNLKFYTPPHIVPLFEWRKYWFYHYFEEFKSAPKFPKLKSGYIQEIQNSPHSSNLNITNNEYFNIDKLIDTKTTNLKDVYNVLHQYYIEFHSNDDLPVIDESNGVTELSCLYKIEQLIEYYDSNNFDFFNIVHQCIKLHHSDFYQNSIKELIHYIVNLWIKKCKFFQFKNFQIFENLYSGLFDNEEENSEFNNTFSSLRFNLYTYNPTLLFPKFFSLIIPRIELNLNIDQNFIRSSSKNSVLNLIISKPNIDIETFFLDVLHLQVIYHESLIKHEMNYLYFDKLQKLHSEIDELINLNCFGLMYKSFKQVDLSSVNLKLAYAEYKHQLANPSDINDSFGTYYSANCKKIKDLLLDKIFSALKLQNLDLLHHNYRYFNFELEKLLKEVTLLNKYICKLYNPILNWIFMDIR